MTDPDDTAPWLQRNLQAAAVGGVISGVVLFTLSTVYTAIANVPLPLPLPVMVLIGLPLAVVVASFVSRKWRATVWANPWRWVTGLRLTTAKQREGLDALGYERRSAEVEQQRRRSPAPSWSVTSDRFFDEEGGTFWLNNRGHTVTDVNLTAEPEFFDPKAEAFWPDPWTAGTGKFFEGTPTEKGREQGIPFHIEWTDAHGDRQSSPEPVVLRPEDMLPKPTETREEAHQRGRAERQSEVDAERASPRLEPKWVLQRNVKEGETAHVLVNYEPDAKATNVQLHPPVDRLTIYGNGRWENELNLDPGNETRRVGHFLAALKGLGKTHGAMVKVTWQDELGDYHEGTVFLDRKPKPPPSVIY